MTASCLINNYNYGRYVGEAVESALVQSVPFSEIVVVDDGSTDDSLGRLRTRFSDEPAVRILAKANAGQLSCFNVGLERSTGEILCFLDADDVYEPTFLENVLDVYRQNPRHDFVYTGHTRFGLESGPPAPAGPDRDLGFSVLATLYLRKWVGAPTSCLTMRRGLAERILPLPFVDRWRTRADDCLVFGSSILGGRKFHLAQPLVRYRVHGRNFFANRDRDRAEDFMHRLALVELFEHFSRQRGYNLQQLSELCHREFQTIPLPTLKLVREYCRITLRSAARPTRKIAMMASIAAYYLRHAGARAATAADQHERAGATRRRATRRRATRRRAA